MVYAARGMAADFDASLAGVAELVDALDLGSSDESCGGSSPSARTTVLAPEISSCEISRGRTVHKQHLKIIARSPCN